MSGRYGQPAPPAKRRWSATDPRYATYKWKKRRLIALNRDGWRCWVPGCPRRATVADHIERVTKDTTDAEFYAVAGLRASCAPHNMARGIVADHELTGGRPSGVIAKDYTRRGLR